jgi:hypothetical protein
VARLRNFKGDFGVILRSEKGNGTFGIVRCEVPAGATPGGVPPKFNLARGHVVLAIFFEKMILPYPSLREAGEDEDEIFLDFQEKGV